MKKIFLILLIFSFISTFFLTPVLAANVEVLSKGQTIDSDYFRVGDTILIEGDIKGDAVFAGGIVTVNGNIDGDLFVAGGKVNVNGAVSNNIRVTGGDITLSGSVGRNVLLVGGNRTIDKQAAIGGSLIAAGGNLDLSAAKINRGFRFFGGRLYLNTTISNEAFVVANSQFMLGPQASVAGNLKYTGKSEAVLEPGATVSGSILFEPQTKDEQFPRFFGLQRYLDIFKKLRPVTEILTLIVSFIIGFILLGLFPRGFEKTVMAMENRPYAVFGWGIISILIRLLVIGLLIVTIVGIPLAFFTFLISIFVAFVARFVVAFFLGRKIMLSKFGERRGWAMVLGLTVFTILGLIPVVGIVIHWILLTFAIGALVLAYRQPVIYVQKPLPFETINISPKKPKRGRPSKK